MKKLWSLLVFIVAIVVAVLAVTLPQTSLRPIFIITTFFDVMIPILAVGALIKYLCCCKTESCCSKGTCDTNACTTK